MKVACQIGGQEVDCAALAGAMSDENNLVSGYEPRRNLLIEGTFFRHMLTLVVGFFPMKKMVVATRGIVGVNHCSRIWTVMIIVLVNMCAVMVYHHNHAAWLCGNCGCSSWTCVAKEGSQARDFFHIEVMAVRLLEKGSLGADQENKLVSSVRLDLTDAANQINCLAPIEIAWEFAV